MDRPIALEARSVDLFDEPPFELGRARIDPRAHEYVIGGISTRIQPQMLKVLVALHDKRGRVVTRDELIDRCWGGRIVGDDVINRCISLLRVIAAESEGFQIETIPRSGYRLIETEKRRSPKRAVWIGVAAAVVAVLGASSWFWIHRPPSTDGLPPAPVVTVAPFTSQSSDSVARDIARAAPISISHMLSESGLPVVLAQSRADAAAKSDYVISGDVRRSGDAVDVNVQMNATRGGTMVYSHAFDSLVSKSADLPDQIGALLAAELAWTGAEMVLDPRHPLDPQITSEMMKSISLTIEAHDSLRAYQIARRLAPMAPNSAIAQLDLAISTGFGIDAIPRAQREEAVAVGRRAGDRARALAPQFGDVYTPWCLLHSPIHMAECEVRLRKGMEIDPSTSFVPGYLSSLLYEGGRIDESVALARVSLANDPYKPAKLARMIRMLEAAGRSDEANNVFNESTRLWPDNFRARASRLQGMAENGNYEGIGRVADSAILDVATFKRLTMAAQRRDLPAARRACDPDSLKPLTQSLCMTELANLGDLAGSFAIATRLYPTLRVPKADEERVWLDNPDSFPLAMLSAPAGKAMRTDRRFLILARNVGLLDYWRSGRLPDFCTKAHEPECRQIVVRKPG